LALEKLERLRSFPPKTEPSKSHKVSEDSGRSLKCRSKKNWWLILPWWVLL